MQLIEIVQLALLIFIVLSAIIFFFSYLGYRTKSNIKDFPKPKIAERKENIQESMVSNDFVESPVTVEPNKSVKQNPRFKVFNPDSDDKAGSESEKSLKKKSHSPKTLVIRKKS